MNEDKLMGLVHQAVGDFGSILTGALVVLGDRLDLYRHLADAGLSADQRRAGHRGRLRGTLRPRMAQRAGSQRLPHVCGRPVCAVRGAGDGLHRREQPGLRHRGLPGDAGRHQGDRSSHRRVPHR